MAQYAIRGYAVDALDYVLKPVSYFAFSQRLSRAIGRMKKRETKMIMVSMKGGTVRINIANIYYIESQGHTLILHTILGDYETTGTMKEMEEKLADMNFCRGNKGYLINLAHVDGITDGCAMVKGEQLVLSRARKKEFMASFEWQVVCYFFDEAMTNWWLCRGLLVLIYGAIALILYKILRVHMPKDGKMNISHREYISAGLIAVAVFAVSNMSFLTENTPFSGRYSFEIGNIRTLVDLGGIAILYAHLIQCRELRVRKELESVQNVLQNQYVQYKQSRESIELINYKYHDLKHQIAFLRSEDDPKKREEYLNRMEDEIRQYETQNKTGNKVLDTVLTTKSLYCAKHGITFTCVADGTLLDFMDVMDICSIFGNALDNAIECELKIPDKEKRLVHVTVSKQKNFLLLRFENYYEGNLEYQEGKLVTTKKEKEYHGYGLKSIRYTVNKYDGAVSIDTKENWFDLKILIPMRDKVI